MFTQAFIQRKYLPLWPNSGKQHYQMNAQQCVLSKPRVFFPCVYQSQASRRFVYVSMTASSEIVHFGVMRQGISLFDTEPHAQTLYVQLYLRLCLFLIQGFKEVDSSWAGQSTKKVFSLIHSVLTCFLIFQGCLSRQGHELCLILCYKINRYALIQALICWACFVACSPGGKAQTLRAHKYIFVTNANRCFFYLQSCERVLSGTDVGVYSPPCPVSRCSSSS